MTLSRTDEIRQVASEWEFDKRILEAVGKWVRAEQRMGNRLAFMVIRERRA